MANIEKNKVAIFFFIGILSLCLFVGINVRVSRKLSFFSIYFTVVLDNLGWALAIPIFPLLFLGKEHVGFCSGMSLAARASLLGLFLGAFPLAQFLGAPLLGEYGDKSGRRKALIVSVFFTVFGYGLTAWSILFSKLWVLFFARIITGVFAGNLSICLASIADLSKQANEGKN